MEQRQIKFRAFDKSDGRMLQVVEPEEQGKREYYPFEVHIGFSYWNKEDIVLMQWTGLNDKSGTPIYEGDIVRFPEYYETPEMTDTKYDTAEVIFAHGAFYIKNSKSEEIDTDTYTLAHEMFSYDGNFEVIGNIHQHPHLLNK